MLLLIGILLLVSREVRQATWVKPLAGVLVATVFFSVLFEFGSTPSCVTWLCCMPYSALLLWCVMGALAIVERGDKWFFSFLPCHLVVFVAMWNCAVTVWPGYMMPAPDFRADWAMWFVEVLAISALVGLAWKVKEVKR